jgi:hypothetical protein
VFSLNHRPQLQCQSGDNFEARDVTKTGLPKELQGVRETATRAIFPIKPADASTRAEPNFLFTAKRTAAGRNLPPYYVVYFLLVSLLGFRNLGRFEKIDWSVPIDLDGTAYLIDHRKFGLGVFAQEPDREEEQARRIVTLIKRGVKAANPFFEWMARNAVRESKISVRNVGGRLFDRYVYFRNGFQTASAEAEECKREYKVQQRQRQFPVQLYSARKSKDHDKAALVAMYTYPWVQASRNASWLALAAIDAFFAWTEHIFIHLAILQGKITKGEDVYRIAEADWGEKFKCALDIGDRLTKKHFDELVTIRRQLRNFIAHGAFGKQSEAFSFHSEAGAVPVALDHRPAKPQFSLTPELAFDNQEALNSIERFIAYLWSGQREPARIYIQESSLPLILPKASDGTYAKAMASVDNMNECVYDLTARFDRAGDMDW